jgi:outer membrane protein assembly factor BamB
MKLSRITLAILVCTPAVLANAGDWAQWRGPNRDGLSTETGWLATWPQSGPKKLWEAPVGVGYSSMSVSQGRVYTMLRRGKRQGALEA